MNEIKVLRNVEIEKMIEERKEFWDSINEKRMRLAEKIACYEAQIMFREELGEGANPECQNLRDLRDKVYEEYLEEIKRLEPSGKNLDKEIFILEDLKSRDYK